MIFSMITGDMFTFGIIYLIVLFGFSQAFYFLYKGHPQVDSTLFATYPNTWMALFQTTLGDYSVSLFFKLGTYMAKYRFWPILRNFSHFGNIPGNKSILTIKIYYQYSDLNNTTYPNLAKTVFVIFMIFVPILLLNMLIAMMGNTYAHVIEQSEKE